MPEQLDVMLDNALDNALKRPDALLEADPFKRAAFEHQLVEVPSSRAKLAAALAVLTASASIGHCSDAERIVGLIDVLRGVLRV